MVVATTEPRFDGEPVRLSALLRPRRDIEVRWAVTVALMSIVSHHIPGNTGSRRPDRDLVGGAEGGPQRGTPDARAGCHGTTHKTV